jgi:hypothetical protein
MLDAVAAALHGGHGTGWGPAARAGSSVPS